MREQQSHLGYLEALLAAEMEERDSRAITRLLHDARLPRMKTLKASEFDRSGVLAAQMRELAEGEYVTKAEPVLLIGEAGTGKTHLATGLCVAACRQRRRVRFTTATGLIVSAARRPGFRRGGDHACSAWGRELRADVMVDVSWSGCRFAAT
ncbi:ATP-binding protein [Falsiroseomonas sp. E2-1-a4]|uniref:ATP-binding protein n=1 Tax=Falsiroseomonas sp. E2-1-a4 TaxID=3239299 RepID=UPI003F32ABF1